MLELSLCSVHLQFGFQTHRAISGVTHPGKNTSHIFFPLQACIVDVRQSVMAQNLGELVRKLRLRRKLSQASLAASMGVSQQEVSSLENNGTNFNVRTLERLAVALDADLRVTLRLRRNRVEP